MKISQYTVTNDLNNLVTDIAITLIQLYQGDIYNFGEANYSLPPSCLVSVYGSPGAVPLLHYAVPLVGVANPITLHIHRSLRATSSSGSGKLLYIMC